ncbi:MAG: hypothetical protein CM15mP120_07530 [Pseudomonadota bacterium]|nr:MAG: hypothetical protein CM15mP120_07530 [Pseudomonadota bacterium]
MRSDLELVAKLIQPEARVLDLGCGEGDLLDNLQQEKALLAMGLIKTQKTSVPA